MIDGHLDWNDKDFGEPIQLISKKTKKYLIALGASVLMIIFVILTKSLLF